MTDVSDMSIEQLEDVIAQRRADIRSAERSDQAVIRTVLLDAMGNGLVGPAFRRVMERSSNKGSDITLFEGGGAHKFDVAITLLYHGEEE